MAIGTDDVIHKFGTQDTLGTSSSAVSDGSFSVAGDLSTWTNDDDAVMAQVILEANFSVAPDASSYANLYLRLLNIESTNDADVPDGNFAHVFVGAFPLNNVTTAQYCPITIPLPNTKTSQEYEFYVENLSGQSLPAGWDIHVTPVSYGPHA